MEKNENSKKGVKKGKTTNTKKAATTKKTTVAKKSTSKETVKSATKNTQSKEVVETKEIKNKKVLKKQNWFKKTGNKFSNKFKALYKKCENDKQFFVLLILCIILATLILGFAVFGRVPRTKNGNAILAKLNGKTITVEDLYTELKDQYGVDKLINKIDSYIASEEIKSDKDIEAAKEYAKQAVEYYKEYAEYYGVDFETFLASYVGVSGVKDEDSFYNFVFEDYKKTLAVKNYIASTYTDKEVKKYYNENYAKLMTVKQILIEIEEGKEEEASNKAKDLISQLNKVKNDSKKLNKKFEELAYDNSDDSTYSDGGLMKEIAKSDVSTEFWNSANKLKKNEFTTTVVKDEYGYHIILKVSESKGKSLKKVEAEIRKALAENDLNSNSNLQVTAWDELRNKYGLKIYDKSIKKRYNKTISDYKNNNNVKNITNTQTEEE